MSTKPFILHLSGDFPDPINHEKTPVIRRLLELTEADFDHHIVSINRASPFVSVSAGGSFGRRALVSETLEFEHGLALKYHAFGQGVLHRTKLVQLGRWLANSISGLGRKPELLVGHKLTIEGIAVHQAAKILGIPYALCIQGNTDSKIIGMRPDLAADFRRIFHEAETVFPFAPWALHRVEAILGKRVGITRLLPCPTELDEPMKPVRGSDGFVTVFHLRNHANKNLAGMTTAMQELCKRHSSARLNVIGTGSRADISKCRHIAKSASSIKFSGGVARGAMSAQLNRAIALVLPSHRESYGLVFAEALFAGIPIIYPNGTAVDGYFDALPFAIAVDAKSTSSIARAMSHCIEHEGELKEQLALWQKSDAAKRFTRASIARTFKEGLMDALMQRAASQPRHRALMPA